MRLVCLFAVSARTAGAVQGQWIPYPGSYNAGGLARCPETPAQGLVKPTSGFGNVWCGLGGAQAAIGWAIDREHGFGAGQGNVRAQDFANGVIFQDSDGMSRNLAYVLFSTGRFIRLRP